MSVEITFQAERYKIVDTIVKTEATYKECLDNLVQVSWFTFLVLLDFKIDTEQHLHVTKLTFNSQIEEEARNRKLLDDSSLDKIFCSIQSIYQSHEMFNLVLASRLNEWTVHGKLGDIICASVSKQSTLTNNLNPSN